MNIKQIKQTQNQLKEIDQLIAWEDDQNKEIEKTVENIIKDIRLRGDQALITLTQQLDQNPVKDAKKLKVPKETLIEAWEEITDEERQALQVAKKRITQYSEKQKLHSWVEKEDDESFLGQQITALDSVGLYVPGGTAAYPSSVLMNAIPAKVAGVSRIVMVTPAMQGEITPLVLAAAFLCNIDEVYTIGGAQAVAALAFGTNTIAPVNKIVGPGNIYVATAKKQVFGKVDIDMIAGPSEITIISDGTTNPKWIAADLFSQAEHDPDAQAILITTSESHANDVLNEITQLIEKMPRHEIITQSLEKRGAIILVDSIERAIEISNHIAPEHLEISTKNAIDIYPKIKHAGAIFIGPHTSESLGDYVAGTNHVLPTSGTAKFSSPLGVYDFQKRSSLIYFNAQKAAQIGKHAETIATSERLFAHALSAKLRGE